MEKPKIYIDTNVFLYLLLGSGENHKSAKAFLLLIEQGRFEAHTSCLTYDEIFWKVKKLRSYSEALLATKFFLSFQNLNILDVNKNTIWKAHELQTKYELGPRDAIHAATAILHNIKFIVSGDADFDKLKEIKRRGL